ncbi:hypothetical protein EUGRSUZ_C02194 [Eucalyptus grandis]|uniref:Uncharacterized protein n=2 Tax=Eucalyptus grandis TaxID=71139 RepID=A0ACC3LF14_EUCGR|nr:hypothetical protein EUGRSUZ_C02194 [Eucalyptus grandis]
MQVTDYITARDHHHKYFYCRLAALIIHFTKENFTFSCGAQYFVQIWKRRKLGKLQYNKKLPPPNNLDATIPRKVVASHGPYLARE